MTLREEIEGYVQSGNIYGLVDRVAEGAAPVQVQEEMPPTQHYGNRRGKGYVVDPENQLRMISTAEYNRRYGNKK
ncbi:hypothetical protein KY363_02965 [Candidatus Woesearchaeota archaeon]|nr:hypothetical protein [Candidatus Woesearchaeota archaeon]